jgi:hypothetical protein
MSKARRWRSRHMKQQVLTHGEKKEMKTSPKAKVYARGFHFTD